MINIRLQGRGQSWAKKLPSGRYGYTKGPGSKSSPIQMDRFSNNISFILQDTANPHLDIGFSTIVKLNSTVRPTKNHHMSRNDPSFDINLDSLRFNHARLFTVEFGWLGDHDPDILEIWVIRKTSQEEGWFQSRTPDRPVRVRFGLRTGYISEDQEEDGLLLGHLTERRVPGLSRSFLECGLTQPQFEAVVPFKGDDPPPVFEPPTLPDPLPDPVLPSPVDPDPDNGKEPDDPSAPEVETLEQRLSRLEHSYTDLARRISALEGNEVLVFGGTDGAP